MGREALTLDIKRKGRSVAELTAKADPKDMDELHQLLVEAVRRDGRDELQIADYEMEVWHAGDRRLLMTFVATHRQRT